MCEPRVRTIKVNLVPPGNWAKFSKNPGPKRVLKVAKINRGNPCGPWKRPFFEEGQIPVFKRALAKKALWELFKEDPFRKLTLETSVPKGT